jgi:thiol-disulfide isomerase/thioredoxin
MRFRSALAFGTVALIAAAIGVVYYVWRSAAPQPAATQGAPFARAGGPKEVPALQFEDAAGHARSLADFKGKVVLLNLWATWCAPCREEMPALDRLQAELGGPRFEVVALSVDQQGAQIARKFFAEAGVKSLALYVDPSAQAAFKLGAAGLPASLLVDASGREVGRHLGPAKWDSPEVVSELRRRIEAAQR